MSQLNRFRNLHIDWEMEPADAVALYLEWGNNGYGGSYENRVKSKDDVSNYFVVYNWEEGPKVCLVRRTMEGAEDLACVRPPADIRRRFEQEVGGNKGVYPINGEIRTWLEQELYN
jgi:hypothetical protein